MWKAKNKRSISTSANASASAITSVTKSGTASINTIPSSNTKGNTQSGKLSLKANDQTYLDALKNLKKKGIFEHKKRLSR